MNGKPEGIGTYTYFNNEIYDGQWVNGMKHGSGIWRGSKNDSYIGEWKFGKPDGYGVHTWINGNLYCHKNMMFKQIQAIDMRDSSRVV